MSTTKKNRRQDKKSKTKVQKVPVPLHFHNSSLKMFLNLLSSTTGHPSVGAQLATKTPVSKKKAEFQERQERDEATLEVEESTAE